MTIKRDLNQLITRTADTEFKRLPARSPILARQGRSELTPEPVTFSQPSGVADLTQVIEVYSKIILTEAGAFELPQNWPANGEYVLGGGFVLDTDEPHYIQRRVHAAFYISANSMIDHYYLIKIEHPYTAEYGLINTLEMPALFYTLIPLYADFKMTGDALLDQLISDKLSALVALGVS